MSSLTYRFVRGGATCLFKGDQAVDAADYPLTAQTRQWLHDMTKLFDDMTAWNSKPQPLASRIEEIGHFRETAQLLLKALRRELYRYVIIDESHTAFVSVAPQELMSDLISLWLIEKTGSTAPTLDDCRTLAAYPEVLEALEQLLVWLGSDPHARLNPLVRRYLEEERIIARKENGTTQDAAV